ncbi:MAG: excinuclease ABC subunit A, partial [Planctomycetota bacterium]
RDKPEADWPTRRLSVHLACEGCGRSFEPLAPQNFSFNSPLGWCEACEGLGVETGTDPSVLIANPNLTLAEGAVSAWPDPEADATFGRMLDAMSVTFGLPLDVPFFRLSGTLQRVVLYGADASVEVPATADEQAFRFRYRGLYPSVEEAQRLSYFYRQKLREMVGEGPCTACRGDRVRDAAAAVKFGGVTLPELARLPMGDAFGFLDGLKLTRAEKKVAGDLLTESVSRLRFLVDVGLDYIALDRPMPTLSGGESQRIRLAGQIGRALTGVLYVLDEPTIGLHPRDNENLLNTLTSLKEKGNSLVVVEHDEETIRRSDHLIDLGPGAGQFGGEVVWEGAPAKLFSNGNGAAHSP